MNTNETQSRLVSCDRIGWDAIQHKDGWWVGTEKGVTCYGDHKLARVALTIIWQREGGRQLNYRIRPFIGANVQNGEHTPKLSALDALKRYEAKSRLTKRSAKWLAKGHMTEEEAEGYRKQLRAAATKSEAAFAAPLGSAAHPALQRTWWMNLYPNGQCTGTLCETRQSALNRCTYTDETPDAIQVEVRIVPVTPIKAT